MHEAPTSVEPAVPRQPTTLKLSTDWISPVNAVVVAGLALLDLIAPDLDKWTARLLSLLLGAFALFLLWRVGKALAAKPAGTPASAVWRGLLRRRSIWLAGLVLVSGAGLLLARGSQAQAGTSVLASHVPGADKLQALLIGLRDDTQAIRGDTKAIREALAPSDARGRLRTLGYGLDDESKARAIESCDLAALRLYIAAAEPLPLAVAAFGTRGGSVLEKPLLARNERLPEVLELLAGQGMKFDQTFLLTFTQAQTAQIPRFNELVKKVPAPLRLGVLPATAKANALTLAIWFDNGAAARKLVSLGSRTDVGVELLLPQTDRRGAIVGGLVATPIASAADEARRLQHVEWLQ